MPRVLPSQVVQVIEKHFPLTKIQPNIKFELDRGDRNACVSIARLVDQIPAELLNPPTVDNYVRLITNIAVLNFALDIWRSLPKTSSDQLTGKSEANPISVIHDILQKCPDEAIAPQTADLSFIDDASLRESLRLDLTSVSNALSNGEFKAATVLAGAITEALLLWAINKEALIRRDDLEKARQEYKIKEIDQNRWGLEYYNKVAKKLAIIQDRTYTQVDLARDFRNLIHPGREEREKAKCNIATAHSGMAAFELVIEDLSAKYK